MRPPQAACGGRGETTSRKVAIDRRRYSALMRGKTVVVTGATSGIGLEAAVSLATQGARTVLVGRNPAKTAAAEQISLEVIDLRSLSPLDMDTVMASVRKTHRAVVVHEAPVFCGFGAEVAAQISHDAFDTLEAPVTRVGRMERGWPCLRACVPLWRVAITS